MATLRNIIHSNTKWWHFMSRIVPTAVITALLFIVIIPLIYWSIYGEGAVGDRLMALPLNTFISEWIALIVVELFLFLQLWKKIYQNDLSKAKSYLMIALIISILYLFRLPITEFIFSI